MKGGVRKFLKWNSRGQFQGKLVILPFSWSDNNKMPIIECRSANIWTEYMSIASPVFRPAMFLTRIHFTQVGDIRISKISYFLIWTST